MAEDKAVKKQELKTQTKNQFSEFLMDKNGLELRKLNMKTDHFDKKLRIRKLSIGLPTSLPTVGVLVVGATGAGKTTLVNAMVNVIFGLDYSDKFRLILIDDKLETKQSQADSQTDLITAYLFNYLPGMPFNYNYLLIDTPGFGDTRGIARDQKLMKQLEGFLNQDYGIDQINGIGIVTPASAVRLTQTQHYIYNGLTAMFGNDVADNMFIMATFSDAAEPAFLDALKEANISYNDFFKFNNSSIFATSVADEFSPQAILNKAYWEIAVISIKKFFEKIGNISPVSLKLTKEVLQKRLNLKQVIIDLNQYIHIGLDKMAMLSQETKLLHQIERDVELTSDYEYTIKVPEKTIIGYNKNTSILWGLFGSQETPIFDTKYVEQKRTLDKVLQRHTESMKNQFTKEGLITRLEDEMNGHKNKLLQLMAKAQENMKVLDEIALTPNPLSNVEYIDLMIETEKQNKLENFVERIEMLEHLKKDILLLGNIINKPNPDGDADLADILEGFKKNE